MQAVAVTACSRVLVTLHYCCAVTGQSVLVISMAFCAIFCDRNLKIGFFRFKRMDFIMTVLTPEVFIQGMKTAAVLFLDFIMACAAGN
jgi:hypothetical protein